ncbi:MAG TPA: FAD-dependent oxidoreductase [Thermoleophilaceae bacterium]|nr:FAD-dependent oxidoreductase [Thermoleophilaceae bacterium]
MSGFSRREVLRAGAAGAALAATPGWAAARVPRSGRGKRVAVLGGGMAGLAAAHELAERGFRVDVYERKALGGKARSIPVRGTAAGGRKPLPGEHGFRFFPGFYHHVPDSMRRTPFPGNPNGVWDNLVEASETKSPRTEGRADGTVFGIAPDPNEARTPDGMRRLLLEAFHEDAIPPHELAYFVERVMVFLTSCDERRFGEWEHVSWWDFIQAEGKSEEYQKVLARGLTRAVVAAKERKASTRTIGNMGEAFVYNFQQRGNDGPPDRILNAPTNEAWIRPWVKLLRKLGVRFHVGQTVEALAMQDGSVESARVRDRRGRRRAIEADWFVCAMPAERARRLWSRKVLRRDPSLELMDELYVDWMNGIQFYLSKPLEIVRGHMTFIDAPWALTALTQAQFWADRDFPADYGDGGQLDCFSIDVSDWDTPGIVYGKKAKRCTPKQVAHEVLEQIKLHLNDNGEDVLTDDMIDSWHLDPAIRWRPRRGRNTNDEPLLVNTVGSWERRPEAGTKVPNLFLAGDYVRTDVDLATMEGANESGRAAVNALLDAAGSKAEPVEMYTLYDPPEFEAAKAADRELYAAGQPNALDKP